MYRIIIILFFPLIPFITNICFGLIPKKPTSIDSTESVKLSENHLQFRLRQIKNLLENNLSVLYDPTIKLKQSLEREATISHQEVGLRSQENYGNDRNSIVNTSQTFWKKGHKKENQHLLEGNVHEEWVRHFSSNSLPSEDHANAIAVDRNGNVYITGVSFTSYTGADYFTIKYNQRGDILWSHRFNGAGNGYDEATAIAVDRNGCVYITGYSYGGKTAFDYVTLKYNPNGTLEWIREYNSPDDSVDIATCIGLDSLNGIIVSGYSYSNSDNFDILTIKYNDKGNAQWIQRYNNPDNLADVTFSMVVSYNGQSVITGYSESSNNGRDYITLSYSPDGTQMWAESYTSEGINTDVATSVASDDEGFFYVTGFSKKSSGHYDIVTIKYGYLGEQNWIRTYNNLLNGDNIATSVAADHFGNVYITGSSTASNGFSDMVTIGYDFIGDQKWVSLIDGSGSKDDCGTAIIADNNNLKVFVTGYTNYQQNGNRDITTIRYNNNGTTSWVMTYDDRTGGDDFPSALAMDYKGNVFVTGSSEKINSSYDYLTLKYNSFEIDQWPLRFNNGNGNNWLNAMAVDRNGNVYVCGTDSFHFLIVKFDSTGIRQWVTQFGDQRSNPTSMAIDLSGDIYVTGYTNGPSNNLDYATLRINPNGEIIWSVLYNGTGNYNDMASAIAVSNKGNVFITGSSYGNNSKTDYVTIKYNSQGIEQWVARYNGDYNNHDSATALVIDEDENVYITGASIRYGSSYDYVTIKYLENGIQAWIAYYNGTGNGGDFANAISIDCFGNIYVTGRSYGKGSQLDFATIRYNSNGVLKWVSRFDGPGNNIDYPSALAVDQYGNVCVTGTSYTSNFSTNFATVYFDSNGVLKWQQIYNGEGNGYDRANDVKVDSFGNVYVTGTSQGKNSGLDFLTIKYSPTGSQYWITRYNSLVGGDDEAKVIFIDNFGYVYAAGNSVGVNHQQDFLITKSTMAGTSDQMWPTKYDGPGVSFDVAKALVLDQEKNIFIGGTSYNTTSHEDYLVFKYDNNGILQWQSFYNGSYNEDDNVSAIAADNIGNVILTGTLYSFFYPCNYGTVKFNSSGSKLWAKEYDGQSNSYDFSIAVACDSKNNVIVTGYSSGDTAYDYATIKYDLEGNQLWEARYDGTSNKDDLAYALAVDKNDNIYVTGLSYGYNTLSDYATIKYNSDGLPLWEARYNDSLNGDDRAIAITIDLKSNIYVTGFGVGNDTTYDIITIKYDSDGNEKYVKGFSAGIKSSDQAKAIAVDSVGNVYVVGNSRLQGLNFMDIVIIKYDSNGTEQWHRRYDGPVNGDDRVSGVAIDRYGDVYITGKSIGEDLSYDYVTIKYSSSGELVWSARYSSVENCNDETQSITVDDDLNVYVTGTNKTTEWSIITTIKYSQITNSIKDSITLPNKFQLAQNYPNPFNSSTIIKYSLQKQVPVSLKIYNILGQVVKTLVDEIQLAEIKVVSFDASELPSGIYYYQIKAGEYIETKKMILIR